jgi:hypothetical protein
VRELRIGGRRRIKYPAISIAPSVLGRQERPAAIAWRASLPLPSRAPFRFFRLTGRGHNHLAHNPSTFLDFPPYGVTMKPSLVPAVAGRLSRSGASRRENINVIGQDGAPVDVLLIADSPADIRLMQEAFLSAKAPILLHVPADGTLGNWRRSRIC